MSRIQSFLFIVVIIEVNRCNSFLHQRQKLDTAANSCVLPEFPQNGNWSLIGRSENLFPGESVEEGASIAFKCKNGFTSNNGVKYSICLNGSWTAESVNCVVLCKELKSTMSTSVKCVLNSQQIPCNEAVSNTVAEFNCNKYYESTKFQSKIRYCLNGQWDEPSVECFPVCGQKNVKANTLVVNGNDAKVGDYPWHSALYYQDNNKTIYKCGGSLINQRMVITAAHCITKLDLGALHDPRNYIVGVGKYYREFNDIRDSEAQFSEIDKFIIPKQYRGQAQNFAGDIAIIVTSKMFKLTDRVQPVCLDKDNSFHLTSSLTGIVIGWGYTSTNGKNSENIKELHVPFLDENECVHNLPQTFAAKYYIYDKFCAGYLNKSVAVCNGDSGGGLVFKHSENDRYYIKGIVSTSPQRENSCDIEEYALYTKISEYMRFIYYNIFKYKHSFNYEELQFCVTPKFQANGIWSVVGTNLTISPGQVMNEGTIIQFKCNKGFSLENKTSSFSVCNEGIWSTNNIKCIPLCAEIKKSETLDIKCSLNGRNISCDEAISGSIAIFTCKNHYELLSPNENMTYCVKGNWNIPQPKCVPTCGQILPQTIFGYPWHIIIYAISYNNKTTPISGGSLISPNKILTVASIVENYQKDKLIVAAGKYYREFNDARDIKSQYSKIKTVIIENRTDGERIFTDRIAVIVTIEIFNISDNVHPVCVDIDNYFSVSLSSIKDGAMVSFCNEETNLAHLEQWHLKPHTEDCQFKGNDSDKYCIYYKNYEETPGYCSVGGGIVVPIGDRLYLQGIYLKAYYVYHLSHNNTFNVLGKFIAMQLQNRMSFVRKSLEIN